MPTKYTIILNAAKYKQLDNGELELEWESKNTVRNVEIAESIEMAEPLADVLKGWIHNDKE